MATDRPTYDVAVVGAGPAGLAAAVGAAEAGLDVVLI
ncbi:FAD-dependent oxidoreductase, partial [Streptomyces albiflaviniger]|nr:FAD-dependent oxidoreductase [Streptomyces albiflaviniger]